MSYSAIIGQIFEFSPKSENYFKIFVTLVGTFIVFLASIFLKYAYNRHYFSKHIPGKPVNFFSIMGNIGDLPVLGKGFDINVSFLQFLGAYTKLFPKHPVYMIWISYVPFLIVVKAEGIEEVVTNNKLTKKGSSYNFLHSWLGTGLLTSDGKKWKSRRRLLTPSFHFEILKDFLPVFNEKSQILVKILQNETTKEYTDIGMPITLCSLDIICETTLGVNINAQENKDSEYVKAIASVAEIVTERTFNFKHWSDTVFSFTTIGKRQKEDIKILHDFTRSVIREKKEKLLSGDPASSQKRKRMALMDVLLEHHVQTKVLSEEDIREEVDTFAFEGHDTTSAGISWALYLIGLYSDVQMKLHEELDLIFGDDIERPITTDDLRDMEYLDRILKESQRLYPSVPFFSREATEDVKICGYTIPKGTELSCITYYLHRDEDVFPDPEKFDPDRFLPENTAKRHPYAYIPFSAGSRNCIGQRFAIMEEKVVVANILRNYTLESLDQRDELVPSAALILRSSVPIRIKIRRRQFF